MVVCSVIRQPSNSPLRLYALRASSDPLPGSKSEITIAPVTSCSSLWNSPNVPTQTTWSNVLVPSGGGHTVMTLSFGIPGSISTETRFNFPFVAPLLQSPLYRAFKSILKEMTRKVEPCVVTVAEQGTL